MNNRPAPFDTQAETYDQRVGLPAQDCQALAGAIFAMTRIQPGELILEIGAGTGMIGTWLALPPRRYIGLDLSRRMLGVFRRRLAVHSGTPLLLQADGNSPWPLADATVRVIFSSRALHLLGLAHVVHESLRVAQPTGAVVVMGRVQRHDDSVTAMMQREMQRLLRQHGFQGRGGGQHQRQILAAYRQCGATVLEPMVVVRWTVTRTPWQSIAAWHTKPGLAGLAPPPHVKRTILHDLCRWATMTFGDVQHQVTSEEAYVLQGVRLQPTGRVL